MEKTVDSIGNIVKICSLTINIQSSIQFRKVLDLKHKWSQRFFPRKI